MLIFQSHCLIQYRPSVLLRGPLLLCNLAAFCEDILVLLCMEYHFPVIIAICESSCFGTAGHMTAIVRPEAWGLHLCVQSLYAGSACSTVMEDWLSKIARFVSYIPFGWTCGSFGVAVARLLMWHYAINQSGTFGTLLPGQAYMMLAVFEDKQCVVHVYPGENGWPAFTLPRDTNSLIYH